MIGLSLSRRTGSTIPVIRTRLLGKMESCHETGRLARIDAALLSTCQSLWAIHARSHATYSFVTHQARLEASRALKLRRTYLLCGYETLSLTQGLRARICLKSHPPRRRTLAGCFIPNRILRLNSKMREKQVLSTCSQEQSILLRYNEERRLEGNEKPGKMCGYTTCLVPVTSFHTWNRLCNMARYSLAFIRCLSRLKMRVRWDQRQKESVGPVLLI